MKKVFTFWEPKEKVPGYVRLCMDTWKDCLPGYETVVLDYGTLGDWLTPEEQRAILCRKMTLAMQSDCIRCAMLKKHGGVWMDADTVLTKPLDGRFCAADCTIVARRSWPVARTVTSSTTPPTSTRPGRRRSSSATGTANLCRAWRRRSASAPAG